jgi:tripartite-type tricarboxylate transporter receptor subunit TctC
MIAGVDMLAVPYRGDALPDLIAGRVQVMFAPIAQSIGYIRARTLRALAVELNRSVRFRTERMEGRCYEASGQKFNPLL